MVSFSSKLSRQISFLLYNLNDSNSDSVFQELCNYTMDGMEGSILLLQACFDHLNIYSSKLKDIKLQPIFASIFKHVLNKPNFSSILSESLQSKAINDELLQNLSDALHLSVPDKIGVGLAMSNSEDHDTRMCGKNFCLSQITELCANPVAFESTEIIQHILVLLSRSEGLSKHLDSFLQMLSLVQLKAETQFVITPFLHDELRGDNFFRLDEGSEDDFDAILAEMEKEISIADVMCELGYGCTANLSQCKEMLSLFLPLTDATVAKILGTIARTYAGLDNSQNVYATFRSALGGNSVLDLPSLNSWNVDVLVDSIKQLAPGINWIYVMENLDHEGFYIPNEAAFSFFMSIYKHACQEPFPLHTICGSIWKNVEGQLSFLKNAVAAPPEVFTFAHSERQLSYDDAVRGHTLHSGPNRAWSCHNLLVVLCQLSEMGHASFIRSVIESPLNNFPEVLLLGMAHVNVGDIRNDLDFLFCFLYGLLFISMKPAQSSSVQPVIAPLNGTPTLPKSRSGALLSIQSASSSFSRSSISTSAKSVSALNIETLVAALERRETPIEVIGYTCTIMMNDDLEMTYQSTMYMEAYYVELPVGQRKRVVMRRVSIEPNFQDLYLKFLDKVNLKPLNKEIVQATYENCKALLGSELIKSSVEERSLLKNLGCWLGKITIGRNKVLRAREMDLKALIIEAYEKGLMIAVIPFTSKILVPCSSSIAYGPPNPWTMGILGLLAEIYVMPNLKMNLKFEIEVLFKHLSVDFRNVTPTYLLKDIVREVEGNPDFLNKDVGSSQPPRMNEVKSGIISKINQVEIPLDVAASPHPAGHSCIMPQYAAAVPHSSGTLTEVEKLVSLGYSDQLPSAQGLLQGQSQYAVNQFPVLAANIEHQVVVNKRLQAYGLHLHFQSVLPVAMDRAVKEIVSGIVQRSVSIATDTTKELVLKDYAMEPDETLIRNAAHLMVARLAGSFAHVTCKEPLRGSLSSQLRSSLQGLAIASDLLEQAFQLVINDNLDLGCVLIEQAATEKAVQTIDGEMDQQLSIRRKHRDSVGVAFYYASLYAQGQMSILPEALRPKPGHLSHAQQRVYEDFARFPGQNCSTQSSNAVPVGHSASSEGGLSRQFASTSGKMSGSIYSSGLVSTGFGAMPQALEIDSDEIAPVRCQIPASVPSSHISIGDGPQTPENDIIPSFLSALDTGMLQIEPSHSAKEPGNASHPTNATLASEHPGTNVSEPLVTTGDTLCNYQTISEKLENQLANEAKEVEIQLTARPESAESLQQLIEIAKNPANAGNLSPSAVGKEEIARTSRDKKLVEPGLHGTSREEFSVTELMDFDAAGFSEQVFGLFAEWYQICELPGANDVACARHVSLLQQRGLLKGDDMTDRFFRRIMELSVSHCLSSEDINSSPCPSTQGQPLSFLAIDIYAKLVFSVLKFCPVDQGSRKLSLLPKVLALTVKFILKDAEERKASFNPRPYFRLFVNWLLDLCSLDPVFEGGNFQVLTTLANSFHAIQPLKVPGFSFAWLELVSHRSFMPKLLAANAQKGWPYIQRLLVDLFLFMEPFLRKAELDEPVKFLYKGTLRVLLVLLHDFPVFLCDYHFSFCDVIPPRCIQMRNIILSAFPRNMMLPDPSTPNLKIDLLAEINHTPRILSDVDTALKAKQIKDDVDEYLKTRQQGSPFLTELKQKLLISTSDAACAGTRYNAPLVNSLVLYVGLQAIQQLQARKPPHAQTMGNMSAFLESAALDVFQTLIMDLDREGRYLFLNAIANQLRYPNNHTHFFSFVLLYLFAESNQELIQEQITRVLLERLIVIRPHPWGLKMTFIELIKNPRYNFWSRSFTRCTPEIEKLFKSVSWSFGGSKPVDDSVVPDTLH
ncbi:CCR4-NOT transcription complex subunit 1-like [Salvia hispanica]|uniref:CCR4-NOT transcription complex subunit 1-like n=1 Tax=Salvia hispanica TaxID=49212 RepID=UPI0020096DA6|nr:CCR4-NOT transcription complex subunit 1-like [Salvia hispanica]